MKTIDKQIRVNVIEAETLIKEIFEKKSCESKEAQTISKRLCLSNLKGHDSHGIVRVPRYVDWIDEKKVYPNREHNILLDSGPGFNKHEKLMYQKWTILFLSRYWEIGIFKI